MRRIAIVTSCLERDWASQELLDAANQLAEGVVVDPITFEMRSDGPPYLTVNGEPADTYDVYIPRGFNRQGEIDYQYEIFELLEQQGLLVINSPAAISLAESKAQTTFLLRQAGLPVPRTLVTQNLDRALAAVDHFGMAVVKPLYGSYGIGIERLTTEISDEILPDFMERHRVVYIQEYVPNEGRDIRAFVVGDEIPAAMYRIAHEGEWRTNVHQGSTCEACELTPEIREMCLMAASLGGLDYTGVDVMEGPDGPVILELNGTPTWHGLLEATGRNIAIDVVGHALQMLEAGQFARQPSGFRLNGAGPI